MAGYDRTSGVSDEDVKINYGPHIVEIFHADDNKVLNLFNKGDDGALRGDFYKVPLKLKRNATGGAGGELDTYPAPGHQTLTHVKFYPTYYRNAGSVTHRAMDDTKESRLAFVDELDQAMEECPEGMKRQMNRDLYAGRWSMRARLKSVAASAVPGAVADVWTLYDAFHGITPFLIDKWGSRALLDDQEVEIYSATGLTKRTDVGVTRSSWTIQSRDTTDQVTIEESAFGPNGIVDGDIIVVKGALAYGAATPTANQPVGNGVFGMLEVYASAAACLTPARLFATFGIDLDRTTVPKLDSTMIDLSTVGAMSYSDWENFVEAIRARSGKNVDSAGGFTLCHKSVRNMLKHWRDNDIRFAPRQANQGIPDDALSYTHTSNYGVQFDWDDLCPPDMLIAGMRDSWQHWTNCEVQFDDTEGKIFHLQRVANTTTGAVSARQVLEFYMFWRGQFACSTPNDGGVLFGIPGADSEYGQGNTLVPEL